jgi:site-specific DNA-methyltransferase (adenine-specific)
MNQNLKIEYIPIEDIKPYENNAKQHPAEQIQQIKNSILEFGFRDPIAVWNNTIVEGHGRLLAAQELGYKELPIIRLDDLSDEQRKAYCLAHNKLTMNSDFDLDVLSAELDSITDIDMSDFGFDLDLPDFDEPAEVVEDDYNEEPPAEPKAKLGDIYQLGRHRLMCGNSLNQEDITTLLNNTYCELTFTDPPYQLETQGGGILKKANSMKQIRKNGVDTFEPSKLLIQSDTNIYCHNKPLIKSYIELAEKNNLPYDLCFYKKLCTFPNYKGHMMTDCEYIAIIGKQDPNKGLPKETYSKCYIGKKDTDNELSYSKPVELCTKYIKLYGKENILDLFGGSGSTLIACEQLNRNCYMMEFDPKYVDVIIDRWEKFTGQKAVKLN